ncbi:hypothetical protein, partial [Salmonella enterica]|uniref:hypothetical protein n=1 Tax=Salmonella enterica TaxID=28901 RepID=UPI003CE7791E
SIHIWGWDKAGAVVTAGLSKVEGKASNNEKALDAATYDMAKAVCGSDGRFDIYLPARESGGPYELVACD